MFDKCSPQLASLPSGSLEIWEEPRDGAAYVIGVDTATGKVKDIGASRMKPGSQATNQQRDYSAAVVINEETTQHVATLHGHIDVTSFSTQVAMLGKYYNTALLVVEVNGPGIAIVANLNSIIKYPNMYRSMIVNRVDVTDPFATSWGWTTSAQSRPMLMNQISMILATGAPFTQDKALVDELRTMQVDPQGVPRAMGRDKDDRVLALAMALQGRFEKLNGSLVEEDPRQERLSRLSPEDRHVWEMVNQRHQELEDGRRSAGRVTRGSRGRDGGSFVW